MRVLIACEYSGTERDAFLRAGHDAMSCDILPTDTPGPHHQGDVRDLMGESWDLVIAHPPCTYLSNSGRSLVAHRAGQVGQDARGRRVLRPHVGVRHAATGRREPDPAPLRRGGARQGAEFDLLSVAERSRIHYASPGPDRWKLRSTSYPGIAAAMANQWGNQMEAVA